MPATTGSRSANRSFIAICRTAENIGTLMRVQEKSLVTAKAEKQDPRLHWAKDRLRELEAKGEVRLSWLDHEMPTSVLLITRLFRIETNGTLLAIGDDGQMIAVHS